MINEQKMDNISTHSTFDLYRLAEQMNDFLLLLLLLLYIIIIILLIPMNESAISGIVLQFSTVFIHSAHSPCEKLTDRLQTAKQYLPDAGVMLSEWEGGTEWERNIFLLSIPPNAQKARNAQNTVQNQTCWSFRKIIQNMGHTVYLY